MLHTLAFTGLLNNTANQQLVALTDGIFTIQNSNFLPSRPMFIQWAWAGSATIDRARIVTPKFRQVTLPFIRPINAGALPVNVTPEADYRRFPLGTRNLEEIQIDFTTTVAMGTERCTVVLGVSDGPLMPVPGGDIYTLRGTSTTAAVANAWTQITTTFVDTFPEGQFAVVGLEVQSANAIAARLIFEDQAWRPGAISITAIGNRADDLHRKGGMGVLGRFTAFRFPNIEVLANAADASHVINLECMRIG